MCIIIIYPNNRMKYFLILFLITILLYYFNTLIIENFKNLNYLNNLFLNNQKSIFKVNIKKEKKDIDECYKKCNSNDCYKLEIMKKNYNKCISCQKNKNKCFNNLIQGGNCESCSNNLKKFDCYNLNNFACPDLSNVYNKKGVQPYFLEIKNKNLINNPYDQSCLFCWNLKNYL